MKKTAWYIVTALFAIYLSSCSKKDPVESNDEELITTIVLQFTSQGNAPLVYEFSDVDGPGGNDPVADIIALQSNTDYTLNIILLDESKTPVETISDEVKEEGEDHRLYLIPSGSVDITSLQTTDADSNGMPLGLSYNITTGEKSQGTLRVVLKHYANGGKESSDPFDSPKSSTDSDVQFTVAIE